MIVPSIDLRNQTTVQLVGGFEPALDAGDPMPIAERFRLAGEIAVIDLDAAIRDTEGDNRELVNQLCQQARCRVGGGIRDVGTALDWLDRGASKIILGTAARPDVLRELPRERVIAALDAIDGEVVVEGWRTRTGRSITDRMAELRDDVGGFLVTFVEREGRLGGTDLERVRSLREACGDADLTIAGGVTTSAEIAELDRLGVDAQVGMALYQGRLDLGDAIAAPLQSDRPDGLWPTVVVDELGAALGLVYSSAESLRVAVAEQRGVYHSRSRGLWRKGESSGATQQLLRIELDCDRDALRFVVRQSGSGFCHLGTHSCFGGAEGLGALEATLRTRLSAPPPGSFTAKLIERPELLAAKLAEEAGELAATSERADAVWECADVFYFATVALARSGGTLAEVAAELDRRSLAARRRSEAESDGVRASSGDGDES